MVQAFDQFVLLMPLGFVQIVEVLDLVHSVEISLERHGAEASSEHHRAEHQVIAMAVETHFTRLVDKGIIRH